MDLREVVAFLDSELGLSDFPDDSSANGLQVEGASEVEKVAVAVDACDYVFQEAAREGADMVFVHHGLFWGDVKSIRGPLKNRMRTLLKNDISLYACHLPLDAHPRLGNNARIMDVLGLEGRSPFGGYHGKEIGCKGEFEEGVDLSDFVVLVEERLGTECKKVDFGSQVKRVGAVSGGGWFAINEAPAAGIDTLLTGEPSHSAYTLAEELKTNLVFAGHYATESLGVRAVGDELKKKFGLDVVFIDHPTGL